MSSSVEQIKERLTIEDVIGSYIKLERAGNSLKARCPFHNEKTPSFFVSPDRRSYYCFGCGAKGDMFTFVESFEGVDFVGALKILADRAGVTLEKFSPKTTDTKERLYLLLEATTLFLEQTLQAEELPHTYLTKRGLSDNTIVSWRLGYVRNEWRSLSDHLLSKAFSVDEIERAGITKTEGKNTYDRFRGRIMFPIFDPAGRVIAFSGRILHNDDGLAKYLNSPQTEIFDKSKVLYGFDRAKQSIRKFGFSILVEGQMDLLMAHQAGFTNTVASSGTALTADHLKLLKRISNKIIMSFDSDAAGAKAAERGWALALASGMEVKIAALPEGFDPADLILKDKNLFKESLKNAIHLIDFLLVRITTDVADTKKRWSAIKRDVLPYVHLLESSTEKDYYVKKIASLVETKEEFVWDDLKKVQVDISVESQIYSVDQPNNTEILKTGSVERNLAALAVQWSRSGQHNEAEELKKTIRDIIGPEPYTQFEHELTAHAHELAFEAEAYYGSFDPKRIRREMDYLILALREEYLKYEALRIAKEISHTDDDEKKKYLMIRHTEINRQRERVQKEKTTFL